MKEKARRIKAHPWRLEGVVDLSVQMKFATRAPANVYPVHIGPFTRLFALRTTANPTNSSDLAIDSPFQKPQASAAPI
jgi:hypothetical protein